MYEYVARYLKTIDGDTVDVDVDLGFKVHALIRIRLAIVDTPERGKPGWSEATAFTKAWFEANPFFVLRTDHDKSGGFDRWLGECYSASGQPISKALLDAGHATVYKRSP